MEQISLNLTTDLFSDRPAGVSGTPGDPAGQLFRSLLEKSASSAKESSTNRQAARGTDSAKGTAALEEALRQLGLPLGQLRLPGSAVPELVALLEKQGFKREEIQSLIASLSDKDGSIRIDRLLARLQKSENPGRKSEGSVLDAKDIPLVGEALAAMGVGAGKIKEIMERSITKKGELSLERLSGALATNLPGVDSKALLSSILERGQIQASDKGAARIAADPDVKRLLNDLSLASNQDAQKQIREEIGRLLREKGMQPQEVKSFTETLTASHARTLSKCSVVDPDASKKAEADARGVMEKIVLGSERKPATDESRERVIKILEKEKALGKSGLKNEWLQEDGISKASSGEHRAKLVTADPMGASEVKGKSAPEATVGARKLDAGTGQAVEGMTSDLSGIRVQKSSLDAVTATQIKETVSLPDPLPKLIDKMLLMMQGGEQKGRIHITPPELGRLDIDLVIKQGHMQAQLRAENPHVKELLDANLPQLKQQLADLGLVVERFDVMIGMEQNPFSKEQTWTAGHRKEHSSRREDREESSSNAEAGVVPAQRLSLTQIDMLV